MTAVNRDSGMAAGLAERLRGGNDLLGLMVKMPAPATVEIAGLAGFDFVVIDTEHGLADGAELQHHLRAADSVGLAVLVRVSGVGGAEILRVLDAGAEGIIVPHVRSSEDVGRAVAAACYPPGGHRSLALSTRSGRYGQHSVADHVSAAASRTLVIAQIEDSLAAERTEQIVSSPGLDAVFIGPTDLSASLGVPGELDHPDVIEAVERVAAIVVASEETALCTIVSDEHEAARWFARGARIVLFESSAVIAGRFREVCELSRSDAAGPLTFAPEPEVGALPGTTTASGYNAPDG